MVDQLRNLRNSPTQISFHTCLIITQGLIWSPSLFGAKPMNQGCRNLSPLIGAYDLFQLELYVKA